MKKRQEKTQEQLSRDIRFIRKGSPRLRKHKRLIAGNVSKDDLCTMITSIWSNLGDITITLPQIVKGRHVDIEVKKYKRLPSPGPLHKLSRKILVGIYGTVLETAREEKLV